MALVERPRSPYETQMFAPVVPDPTPRHRAAGGCLEAVWVRSYHLPCEARGAHETHFAQFGRHILRWWGPIGATVYDPPQLLFPDSI